MSDSSLPIENGYGTPMVWLYSSTNKVLIDDEGRPIARFITKFEYTYDEEGDDLSKITFQFDKVERLDIPYLRHNVIILVQWGYFTNTGDFVKSPKRTVAIRDLDTEYLKDKIELKVTCTDLVAYLKLFKTSSIRKYQNPKANIALKAIGEAEDNFLDWLAEIAEGKYVATVTDRKQSLRIDSKGKATYAKFDAKTGQYTKARDNTGIGKTFFHQFHAAKIIKGKSKALTNAMDDYLKLLDSSGGLGGPFLRDTTDNSIHIHQRNFEQAPFLNFTRAGGNGDLLSFKPKTDTRKIKEDIAASSGVDPHNKKIQDSQVATVDSSVDETDDIKEPLKESKEERYKRYYEKLRDEFKFNYQNPDTQREVPDLKYFEGKPKDSTAGFYSEQNILTEDDIKMVNVPAREVINTPEFKSLTQEQKGVARANYARDQVLVGYAVEKIQRKFTANAKVLGDPSIIKGRIYGFFNLSKKDSGLWYAAKVTHVISKTEGYITELDLLQKPKTVGINRQNMETTLKNINDELKSENTYTEDSRTIYDNLKELQDPEEPFAITNSEKVNTTEEGIKLRLTEIGQWESFILGRDLDIDQYNDEPLNFGNSNNGVNKEPNADKF